MKKYVNTKNVTSHLLVETELSNHLRETTNPQTNLRSITHGESATYSPTMAKT